MVNVPDFVEINPHIRITTDKLHPVALFKTAVGDNLIIGHLQKFGSSLDADFALTNRSKNKLFK